MSADNGIYIASFDDGYRVIHAQAIDNIDYYPEGTKERKNTLKNYFGSCKIFQTYNEAILEAHRLEKEIRDDEDGLGILEYGVRSIGEFEAFE